MKVYEKFKSICNALEHYPVESELIYKYGISKSEITNIYKEKLLDEDYIKLELKDEFNKPLIFLNKQDIVSKFIDSQNLIRNSQMDKYSDFRDSEMLNGFIFSEIESSLAIEGVRSTRAMIEKINHTQYEDLNEKNDIIIKNMLLGYEFVKTNDITEANIFKLYQILSKNSLKADETISPLFLYREDGVNIVDASNAVVDRGVDYKLLPELMKDMITYIHKERTYEEHLVVSHIIHYYVVYLHPYFDYNGRMARVLSFWYNYKFAPSLSLLLVSEAINHKVFKKGYYNAIMNARQSNNDITYFLEYMGHIILKYTKIYINFYNIEAKLKSQGNILSRSLEVALKYVLAIPDSYDNYFDWKDYKAYAHDDFSKQYYLRQLGDLEKLGILEVIEQKKAKLFKVNDKKWDLF